MSGYRFSVMLVLLAAASSGCAAECEERACDAASEPHARASIAQGVTGVVAYRTDACDQSCCECSFTDAEFSIYHPSTPVNTEGDAWSVVAQGAEPLRFTAHHSYERALDPGEYLICYQHECAALHIRAGDVYTVNAQLRYGPPSLLVFAPGDDEARDDLVFEVNKE